MADITHRLIDTNGIRMHIAEAGPDQGPCVIMCHGFPESWYSWRHQLHALADAGYHAIAPDMRGYGRTSRPADPVQYTQLRLVGDMVGLLSQLPHDTAVIAGHDWGAPVAWNASLFRPDLFPAIVALSVPYLARRMAFVDDHTAKPTDAMKKASGENFHYQLYFNQVGRAEADLERDVRHWLTGFFYTASGDVPPEAVTIAQLKKADRFEDGFAWPDQLPAWLSAADLDFYTSEFERTGFRGGLSWYRAIDPTWEEMAPYVDAKLTVPACFVAGDRDGVIAANRAIYEAMPAGVPDLRLNTLLPGCGHWTQQERPAEVNDAMLTFPADVAPL